MGSVIIALKSNDTLLVKRNTASSRFKIDLIGDRGYYAATEGIMLIGAARILNYLSRRDDNSISFVHFVHLKRRGVRRRGNGPLDSFVSFLCEWHDSLFCEGLKEPGSGSWATHPIFKLSSSCSMPPQEL